METPPVPKPRNFALTQGRPSEPPTPMPRHIIPAKEKVDTNSSDLLSTISNKSKQFTEGVAAKITNSAKGTLEKTKTTSRAVRDSVAKSVIEGTNAGMKLLKPKKNETVTPLPLTQRCASLPEGDVNFFENISFISPLQRKYMSTFQDDDESALFHLNNTNLDELSFFSSYSNSYSDSLSDTDQSLMLSLDEQMTYDTPRSSWANSVASAACVPNIPERKKHPEGIEKVRRNTSYENYQLPTVTSAPGLAPKATESKPRPSQSTICEFDPLNASTSSSKYKGVSNELLLLESFLIGDTYGTVVGIDNNEDILEYVENDYFNPPNPPERFDSLADIERQETAAAVPNESHTSWYVTEETDKKEVEVKRSNSMMQKFSRKLKLDNVLHKPIKVNEPEIVVVQRPPINSLPAPYFSGNIMKTVTPGLVEELFKSSQSRYCVLSEQKLVCYSDPTNAIVKEIHHLSTIYCVQVVLPLSSSATNTYSFELHIAAGPRVAPRKHVFTCSSISERRNWVQKISEHLAAGFPTKYNAEYNRMGWCYLREGVTGEWKGAWVMLVRRVLLYYTVTAGRESGLNTVDLRKAKCVVTQAATPEENQSCPSDESPHLLLDCPQATIYLRFSHERLLKNWRYMIKLAAQTNGAYMHHQQLTKDDVPAIVEKCISFVYAYGSLSEGIYRRNGGSSTLGELLARFRRDAWSVQLSPGTHSEHDVAGVLKRFLRDLPEPLIAQDQIRALLDALVVDDEASRFVEYRRIMLSLPLVARQTARKLFAHLHFLHTMAHANKMNAENLASVWAPTIMPAPMTNNIMQGVWSSKEVFVVRDLIVHFEAIWMYTENEKKREGAMRKILLRVLSNSAPSAPKSAGDLRTWVYVKDKAACYQVALTPSKTAADICIELCEKANIEAHLLMLEEVICNDSMRRIVHIDEVVLDVVLRWSYWDEEDRKDNYLVVKENSILHEMEALKNNMSLVCGELKIATESMKAFKLYMFEFQHSCLCYFKDKQGSHKIEEWNIKDILWYLGHEPKRNPQSRWAITFIPRNKQKRSKEKPWFGCTIAGAVNEDRLKWMTSMMYAEHATILPTPRLVIT